MTEKELEEIFRGKKQRVNKTTGKVKPGFVLTQFTDFQDWYNQETFDDGCHYCGTSNERSFEIYTLRPGATRGGKRGRRLELERKEPNQPYDNLDNLVWCCYWCNNAKSNFFSEEEFRPIANAIGEALNNIQ